MKQLMPLVLLLSAISHTAGARTAGDTLPVKIRHAEPLCTDLIRDLGARRGEREVNVGWIMRLEDNYTDQEGFAEYEFAPLDRLGMEIEIPFRFLATPRTPQAESETPHEKIERIKWAFQYTFLVSEKAQLSMAAGNIFSLRLHSFISIKRHAPLCEGGAVNPFLIVAKRWGRRFHSLLYTGPEFSRFFSDRKRDAAYQINFSMHYMFVPGHFIGVEMNQELSGGHTRTMLNPQAKIRIGSRMALGIATGIPVVRDDGGPSFLARLIYEP